jgi:hypothetical protein
MRPISRSFLAVFLALAPLAAGCATDMPEMPDEVPGEATIEIPLQQIGNDGALYRLRAVFTISNDQVIEFLDGTGEETSVKAIVPNGPNRVRLLDGFMLQRSFDNGATFAPVDAVLGSPNPVFVDAMPGINTVQFDFIVRTPTTIISISFGVDARATEISGTLFITDATGFYEPYERSSIPYRAFYSARRLAVGTDLETGDVFCSYISSRFAIEYIFDDIGLLQAIGPELAGSTLRYELRQPADLLGVQRLGGMSIERSGNLIAFEPAGITLIPKDADGCPTDPALVGLETSLPFTQTTQLGEEVGTISGIANLTFIPAM